MSRKINPTGFRVGITKGWQSNWFAEDSRYADAVVEDDKIRTYLKKELRSAGVEVILIDRSIKSIKMTIKVARPGVVIGRKGSGLALIRQGLQKITESDIDLQIEEVKSPETSASIVAETVAMQIERRVYARRAINIAADKAMDAGAKGAKVQVSGTVNGPNSIALTDIANRGAVPTQTLRADIDYAVTVAKTRGGTIGVKVWIYKGEENVAS